MIIGKISTTILVILKNMEIWRSVVFDPAFVKSHCTTQIPYDVEYVSSNTIVDWEQGSCRSISILSLYSLSVTSLYCVHGMLF